MPDIEEAVESDEWDSFEGRRTNFDDMSSGAAWKRARENLRVAQERLEIAENAVRATLPDDPAPGSTEIARLDEHICGVLKVHTRLNWDDQTLLQMLADEVLTFGEAKDFGLKLSFSRKNWEGMSDDLQDRIVGALTVKPYERLTYVEFEDESEVDDFCLEHDPNV